MWEFIYSEFILGNFIHLSTMFSCKPVQDIARFVCVKLNGQTWEVDVRRNRLQGI